MLLLLPLIVWDHIWTLCVIYMTYEESNAKCHFYASWVSTVFVKVFWVKDYKNGISFRFWPLRGHILTSMTSERLKLSSVKFCFMGVQI